MELSRVIGQPSAEGRLRFSQVDVKRRMEETMVERKNIVTKLVEFGNGLYGLTSCLTFMDGIVCVMTLIVLECPNGNGGVKNMVNDR